MPKNEIDIAWATTDELIDELARRSTGYLVAYMPLTGPASHCCAAYKGTPEERFRLLSSLTDLMAAQAKADAAG